MGRHLCNGLIVVDVGVASQAMGRWAWLTLGFIDYGFVWLHWRSLG